MKKSLTFLMTIIMLFSVTNLLLGLQPKQVSAEDEWPKKGSEFTYIVGYTPGGMVDGTARITAPFLQEELGIPVVIQNAPGAGNLVGINTTFSKPSDGYSWTYGSTIDGIWPHNFLAKSKLPWKLEDWKVLGIWGDLNNMGICVKKDAPWKDFAEFIEDARKRPGEIVLASLGPGRFDDIWVLELMKFFDVKFKWIFYDSSGTIQTDLLTGDLDAGIIATQRADFVNHPNFKVLTALCADLPKGYPIKQPTLREFEEKLNFKSEDLKALKIRNIYTWVVKSDIPDAAYKKLVQVVKNLANNPEWRKKMLTFTWPTYIPPEEAEKLYKELAVVISEYAPLHKKYVK